MTTFQHGQRVQATEDYHVTSEGEQGTYKHRVDQDDSMVQWDDYTYKVVPTRILRAVEPDAEPEPAEQWETINFDQVKVGDRIRATGIRHGVTVTLEGVAAHMNATFAYTAEGGALADCYEEAPIERLVVPESPMPPLPTEPDTFILATVRGVKAVALVLGGDGWWRTSKRVGGCRLHGPEHITAWRPAKVVPADE